MKLNFKLPDDGKEHDLCFVCHADGVKHIWEGDIEIYRCPACGAENDRRIHVGKIKQWTAPDGEWWHESVGILVRNPENKYLFLERVLFPQGYTYPAGHVEHGEKPEQAASRELLEETGITGAQVQQVVEIDIPGDQCSKGADIHHFNIFVAKVPVGTKVSLNEEGVNVVWMTLEDAKSKPLIFANRFIIEKFQKQIEAA